MFILVFFERKALEIVSAMKIKNVKNKGVRKGFSFRSKGKGGIFLTK